MKEEQVRRALAQLKNGMEVRYKTPCYMNGVVGKGYIGYIIPLNNNNGQINVVLKVRSDNVLHEPSDITLIVHSVFGYDSRGREVNIQTPYIGHEVILTANSAGHRVIDDVYRITGILTLKKKPP